ncbi:MAG: glutathione S-transferase family protein [Deltaproteobacteria bacterium]|nr:glutathione S-transferase family protein [Deltaproteobacteria bacterium]
MKLYDCQMAPNPRRVRIFLAEKGLDLPKVEVSILDGDNLKPEFLRINPRGLLPVLELENGTVLDETVAICRYLEETHPEPNLMGATPVERATIESWQRHMEFDGLQAVSEVVRNSIPVFSSRGLAGTTQVPAIPALVERGTASMARFFARIEQRLQETEFVAGNRFTIADITALCAVDTAKNFVKMPIPEGNTNTQRWYVAVSSRPSAKA